MVMAAKALSGFHATLLETAVGDISDRATFPDRVEWKKMLHESNSSDPDSNGERPLGHLSFPIIRGRVTFTLPELSNFGPRTNRYNGVSLLPSASQSCTYAECH